MVFPMDITPFVRIARALVRDKVGLKKWDIVLYVYRDKVALNWENRVEVVNYYESPITTTKVMYDLSWVTNIQSPNEVILEYDGSIIIDEQVERIDVMKEEEVYEPNISKYNVTDAINGNVLKIALDNVISHERSSFINVMFGNDYIRFENSSMLHVIVTQDRPIKAEVEKALIDAVYRIIKVLKPETVYIKTEKWSNGGAVDIMEFILRDTYDKNIYNVYIPISGIAHDVTPLYINEYIVKKQDITLLYEITKLIRGEDVYIKMMPNRVVLDARYIYVDIPVETAFKKLVFELHPLPRGLNDDRILLVAGSDNVHWLNVFYDNLYLSADVLDYVEPSVKYDIDEILRKAIVNAYVDKWRLLKVVRQVKHGAELKFGSLITLGGHPLTILVPAVPETVIKLPDFVLKLIETVFKHDAVFYVSVVLADNAVAFVGRTYAVIIPMSD